MAVVLVLGKYISKFGLFGFVILPVKLIWTSVGIFLLKFGLSRRSAGFAPPGTEYNAWIFIWASNGSPSQTIDPPFFKLNFLSTKAKSLKL